MSGSFVCSQAIRCRIILTLSGSPERDSHHYNELRYVPRIGGRCSACKSDNAGHNENPGSHLLERIYGPPIRSIAAGASMQKV
jgi:hypothetical protein